MSTLIIKYDLKPPASVDAGTLQTSKTTTAAIATDPKDQSQYYAELRKAVLHAKDTLGEELTQWRDAVGKAEIDKETKKSLKEDDEDEDDDSEEV
ncbi:hypothetical protein K523DRAFT_299516 [Schizophyllum commune Tattone D]|nr:hypothetical protein K523DRAFT_299516 [Schizophyllum commune Tattone D]